MKKYRILFIAPHSIPVRSSESIVNSKLAYSLANSGHYIDLFSIDFAYTYPTKENLNNYLLSSPNIKVHITNTKDYDLKKPTSILNFIFSYCYYFWIFLNLGYFYNKIESEFRLLQKVKKHLKKDCNYDFIITRGFSTELVALYVNKKYNIKWIANWNDPYPDPKFPPPYGEGPNAKLSPKQDKYCEFLQEKASCHTFPSERLRNYMLSYFTKIKKESTFIVPHMAHSSLLPLFPKSINNIISFVHCGNVSYPRDPSSFLKALSMLVDEDKYLKLMIRCDFYGLVPPSLQDLINNLGLNEIVHIHNSIDYFSTLEILKKADISLIIEAICDEGIYLPTKVVDSIQSKTPIFAISPTNGTLHDIIRTNKIGYFADNTDIAEILKTLKRIIYDFKNKTITQIDINNVRIFFEDEVIEKYEKIFTLLNNER